MSYLSGIQRRTIPDMFIYLRVRLSQSRRVTARRAVSLTGEKKKASSGAGVDNDARRCRRSNGRQNPLKKQSHIFGQVCRLVDDDECFPRSSLITDMSRLMPLQLMGNPSFSSRATHPPPRLQTDVAALNPLRSVGTHARLLSVRRSTPLQINSARAKVESCGRKPLLHSNCFGGPTLFSCSGFPPLFPNLRT